MPGICQMKKIIARTVVTFNIYEWPEILLFWKLSLALWPEKYQPRPVSLRDYLLVDRLAYCSHTDSNTSTSQSGAEISLGMGSANERLHYFVVSPPIAWMISAGDLVGWVPQLLCCEYSMTNLNTSMWNSLTSARNNCVNPCPIHSGLG